jgi:fused signal recognition particle receptor
MFSFFKKKPAPAPESPPPAPPVAAPVADPAAPCARPAAASPQVFTGTQIDDALYEDLETALLMADTGVPATEFLLQDLKRRVKEPSATDPRRQGPAGDAWPTCCAAGADAGGRRLHSPR